MTMYLFKPIELILDIVRHAIHNNYVFEFDPSKSASNLAKHGIDFEDAKNIWDDPSFVEIATAFPGEPRYLCIGYAHSSLWTAVVTYRGDDPERVRIISVRSASRRERDMYAGN